MNKFEKLFDDFLELAEFTLVKYHDGWGLRDQQEGNLGNIENDRFRDAFELIDRMDAYIEDYLVRPITDNLGIVSYGTTWGEMAKKYKGNAGDSDFDVLMLDALCNHPEEINLENCSHEIWSEKIYTVIYRYNASNMSATSFHYLKDAQSFVELESNKIDNDLRRRGIEFNKLYSLDYSALYISDTTVNYEWIIKESELF